MIIVRDSDKSHPIISVKYKLCLLFGRAKTAEVFRGPVLSYLQQSASGFLP